ncbi:putative membrane protein [Bacillus cereus]|nr:putative membrane protein [Bacillus cereus]
MPLFYANRYTKFKKHLLLMLHVILKMTLINTFYVYL